jgi:hypothetical protein
MNAELPIDTLLPSDLRTELCITGLTVESDPSLLTFRIDPGNAFQRRAYVRDMEGGRFVVGISERYLPDGPRVTVCDSSGIPAGYVAEQLRASSGCAYTWDAERDHWLDARPRLTPAWSGSRRDVTSAAVAAAQRVWKEKVTHYLYAHQGRFVYANNPPREGAFFSVNVRGLWAMHDGRVTYPMENAPGTSAIAPQALYGRSSPARLAFADQAADGAVVLAFHHREEYSRPGMAPEQRRGRKVP